MKHQAQGGKREDLGGQYFRSKWEANYARYLNWMKGRGEIGHWAYEAHTFEFEKIKKGTRSYTPDFMVFKNWEVEWHEVKGWNHPKGATALRRMAKYYPNVKIVLIDKTMYESIRRQLSKIIPGWE